MRVGRGGRERGGDGGGSRDRGGGRGHRSLVSQLRVSVLRLRHGRVLRVAPVGLGGELPLSGETLEVAHKTKTQRILDVQTLTADQVPRHLRRTLPEPDVVVVHGVPLRVVSVRVQT